MKPEPQEISPQKALAEIAFIISDFEALAQA